MMDAQCLLALNTATRMISHNEDSCTFCEMMFTGLQGQRHVAMKEKTR